MTARGFGCNISTQQIYDISQTRCCSLLQKMGFKRIKSSRSVIRLGYQSYVPPLTDPQYIEQFILYPVVLLEKDERCRGLNINTGFSSSHSPHTPRHHHPTSDPADTAERLLRGKTLHRAGLATVTDIYIEPWL